MLTAQFASTHDRVLLKAPSQEEQSTPRSRRNCLLHAQAWCHQGLSPPPAIQNNRQTAPTLYQRSQPINTLPCALPSLRQRLATCFNIIDFWLNTSNPCKALLALARNTSSTRMSQRAASCLQRQPQPHPQHTADNVFFFTVPHPRVQQSNCQPFPHTQTHIGSSPFSQRTATHTRKMQAHSCAHTSSTRQAHRCARVSMHHACRLASRVSLCHITVRRVEQSRANHACSCEEKCPALHTVTLRGS